MAETKGAVLAPVCNTVMTEKSAYIIEFIRLGHALKVTAIDPETGQEVSIVGDPKATRPELSRLAANKLDYVLGRHKQSGDKDKGPGILV